MNNNINIVEILRYCPKGTKLYSPLFGELEFQNIDNNFVFPIVTEIVNEDCKLDSKKAAFTKDGTYFGIPNTESMLFPSRKVRDWKKFFKPGDVVVLKDGTKAGVFDKWNNDKYTSFLTSFSIYKDGTVHKSQIHSTNKFHKADEGQRAFFIMQAEKILKGKYNPETLQVEPVKVKCPFKPFDKVLVRNCNDQVWIANYFSHCKDNNDHHYVCIGSCYRQCIPYNEHTAHLVGTNAPYTEGGSE